MAKKKPKVKKSKPAKTPVKTQGEENPPPPNKPPG